MREPNLVHKLLSWRKEQCSTKKSQLMKLTGFWVAQALTEKDIVSRPLKIKMLSFIHYHWHFHHPDKFLSLAIDINWGSSFSNFCGNKYLFVAILYICPKDNDSKDTAN